MQVLLGGLELLAIGQVLLGELVLLHIQAPGVEERQDKEDGQHAVEHDEEGVVTIDGLTADLGGLDSTQGSQLGHVGAAEAEQVHIENRLEQEEQDAAQPLAAGAGAEAHHRVGDAGLPVALAIGVEDVVQFTANAGEDAHEPIENALEEIQDGLGEIHQKAAQLVQELLRAVKPQKFQIRHAFTNLCVLWGYVGRALARLAGFNACIGPA